jgi:type VI secretion system ImpC/EvpB family protein
VRADPRPAGRRRGERSAHPPVRSGHRQPGEDPFRGDDPGNAEFEFASLGFIPLSYYKNRDYACFFSANSAQKPALYDTADATANSRINARLPYIFLLSRIAHYLKMIQRENIGTTKDRRLLELELNTWVRSLVTEMTDPGDELQASHPLRDARWWWKISRTTRASSA